MRTLGQNSRMCTHTGQQNIRHLKNDILVLVPSSVKCLLLIILICPDCGCVWVPAAKVLINDNQHQLWAVPWERAQCSWCCPPSEARTHVGTAHHVTAPGFWSLVQLETQVDEVFKSRRSLLLYHGHLLVPTSTDLCLLDS